LGLDQPYQPQSRLEDSGIPVLFRVYVPDFMRKKINKKGLFLYGNRPEIGMWKIGSVPLNDEGKNGDQVAHDSVWSAEVPMSFSSIDVASNKNSFPPQTMEYSFLPIGPDVARDKYEPMATLRNFIFYHHKSLKELKKAKHYRTPVHILGYCPYSQTILAGKDFVHPNDYGFEIISQALYEAFIQRNLVSNHPKQVSLKSN